jgi:hypothetical protein
MSADNGIYILESDGPQFRVAEMQNIENLNWDDQKKRMTEEEVIILANARDMFKGAKVFDKQDEAMKEAITIYNDIIKSDFPVIEYGIVPIKIIGKF